MGRGPTHIGPAQAQQQFRRLVRVRCAPLARLRNSPLRSSPPRRRSPLLRLAAHRRPCPLRRLAAATRSVLARELADPASRRIPARLPQPLPLGAGQQRAAISQDLGDRCGAAAASPPGPSRPTLRLSGSSQPLPAGCYCWILNFGHLLW
jgi:hypothetical protein